MRAILDMGSWYDLIHLKNLVNLLELNVDGTRVTDPGMRSLQRAFPNLKIYHPRMQGTVRSSVRRHRAGRPIHRALARIASYRPGRSASARTFGPMCWSNHSRTRFK